MLKLSPQFGLKTSYFCVGIPTFPHCANLACASHFSSMGRERLNCRSQTLNNRSQAAKAWLAGQQFELLPPHIFTCHWASTSIWGLSTAGNKASRAWGRGTNSFPSGGMSPACHSKLPEGWRYCPVTLSGKMILSILKPGVSTSQILKEQLNIGTELQDLALNLLFETHSWPESNTSSWLEGPHKTTTQFGDSQGVLIWICQSEVFWKPT